MLPAQQGYDRAITVFSPDGRLYQVEYAIETVRRGTIAVGVKAKDGIIIAVEEKSRKLQISDNAQKIFQIDDHIGVAAAGYIPDARSQVDNARFFSQSNKLIYDEAVQVEMVARHLADQCQQFTQYAGVRPFGVSLIIGGIDADGNSKLYLTDPSGTYIEYDAIAIGSDSNQVMKIISIIQILHQMICNLCRFLLYCNNYAIFCFYSNGNCSTSYCLYGIFDLVESAIWRKDCNGSIVTLLCWKQFIKTFETYNLSLAK